MLFPLQLLALSSLSLATAVPPNSRRLDPRRVVEALDKGKGILGVYSKCAKDSKICEWMSRHDDVTRLENMSIPGTHDAATWNYTQARQDELAVYTGSDIPEAKYFRCQEHSMFDMLNGGIRAFDWRVAYNPGNKTIGFHHSQAMLDPNATLSDVLYGFYYWLSVHPSEAVLISINHEGSTGTPDDEALYRQIWSDLEEGLENGWWVGINGTLPSLGEARGKLTLLRRFSWDLLPEEPKKDFGIFLDGNLWLDNGPDISLTYNNAEGKVARIEDYYEIGLPTGSGAAENIQWKYNATTSHIQKAIEAAGPKDDQFWISFASSEHDDDVPPETPMIMALGNGTDTPGVNQRLLPWLKERKGKRMGVIMLDFFDSVSGVVEAIINV